MIIKILTFARFGGGCADGIGSGFLLGILFFALFFSMNVLKFGGTSVADAKCIKAVKSIVEANDNNKWIVVSAMSGVTDALLTAYQQALAGNDGYKLIIDNICRRHIQAAQTLLNMAAQDDVLIVIKKFCHELLLCLHQTLQDGLYSARTQDYVLSFGECLNSYLISKVISNAQWVDARTIIKTDSRYGKAIVDIQATYEQCRRVLQVDGHAVMAGFISSDADGGATTLGRGGSDYTAAIVAAAMRADSVEIWTDTDGFMTADPRRIPDARTIEQMTYAEVFDLAKFGAKVVYPPTVYPLLEAKIPMYIRNTFNTKCAGTLVCDGAAPNSTSVCSISAVENAALFHLKITNHEDSAGMLNSALAAEVAEVIFIEHTADGISLAVNAADADAVSAILTKKTADSASIESVDAIGIIAIVGEKLRHEKNICAQISSLLHKNNIAARSIIHDGISVLALVEKANLAAAISLLHKTLIIE
jgi:aspartokinase/homoserine dehydrogenase 1